MDARVQPIPPLARELHMLAASCEIETSDRRCWKVLKRHPDITSSLQLQMQAPKLIAEVALVTVSSVSGVQSKEWVGDVLYKWDDSGSMPSGLVECLVSKALGFIIVDGRLINHVSYTTASSVRGLGCCCRSFLKQGEAEQPLKFYADAYNFSSFIRMPVLQPFLREIAVQFLCDLLMYNEDRHLGNISLLSGVDSSMRLAPLFDMGSALAFVEEPDYSKYCPSPFEKEQVKWVREVLKWSVIRYEFTRFVNSIDRDSLVYPRGTVDYVIEKLISCAHSYYVQDFVEVV